MDLNLLENKYNVDIISNIKNNNSIINLLNEIYYNNIAINKSEKNYMKLHEIIFML